MTSMKPLQTQVKGLFSQAIKSAFPSIEREPCIFCNGKGHFFKPDKKCPLCEGVGFFEEETLLVGANPKFGDYQCNNAMGIFKDHGKALGFAKPVGIAEAIKQHLPKNNILTEVNVAPAGFVTVKLNDKWIMEKLTDLVKGDIKYEDAPKKVVVDFSSPNIAKEMHVGHLRSTIIGESVCRVLEFCGHNVVRLNHVGDWGTQFGMLIEYMKEIYPNFEKEVPPVADLQEFYKASKKRFDDDENFKKKAQLSVVQLQKGDKAARRAWQRICDVSRRAFEEIYKRLDITLEERGESYYNAMIPLRVKELKDKGICVESDGAMCIFTPRVAQIPLMAVKSDGGYGYDSTDLAAVHHRLLDMKADWVIYVTDLGQETHFHMIFDAAEQAGWHKPPASRLDHMGFGVVQGEDKKKFKTRSGETVKLSDLLDEAVDRSAEEIKKRVADQAGKDGGEVFLNSEEEQKAAATKLGVAAVRYFDMKQNRTSPYVFSYDKMLDPKGNTAVYLFYAYARIRAIQRKSGVDVSTIAAKELKLSEPQERELALKLLQFPDVIEGILANLHLHKLTDYLWELSNILTAFYMNCKIVGQPEMRSRLLLCEATRKVLHKSFFLLGFEPLERI